MGSDSSKAVSSFIKRRKLQLISIFDSKCCICGFDKYPSALEFHHINPEEKEFGITVDTTTKALDKQIEELKKCILVCSNCHRGIHSGNVKIPDNYQQFFNKEIANKLLEETYNKRHSTTKQVINDDKIIILPKYTCKFCGKPVSKGRNCCPDCLHYNQRKIERPNREELKFLIRNFSFEELGRRYCVSGNSIRKWCDNYSLPRTKKEINNYSDEEWRKI